MGLGLSRELWLVQAGIFLNMLGYGAVLPFEVIYLHDGRGFSLGVAGLVVGTITGVAVVTAPAAGPLIDRYGARVTSFGAGAALAAGYAGLAFARSPAQAFAAAALAGAGNGALNPSQSTLLATLAPARLRHRATAVSRVAGNAGIGIGGALGGLVAAYGLPGFELLLLANATTVVIAQVPVARLAEGRRRVVLITLAAVLFAAACLLVAAAPRGTWRAYPGLIAASVAVGVGECLHTTALMPLVADLAPAGLRGRYMASMGFSWWIGLAIAPTLGT